MKIELITFRGCPNAQLTRERLVSSLRKLALNAPIDEIDLYAKATAAEYLRWPSPTVLIDGEDIEGRPAESTSCDACRVYTSPETSSFGAPTEDVIMRVLRQRMESNK